MLSNKAHIDGNLMSVRGVQGELFYISFYRATADVPKLAGLAYYAVGFIVQKHVATSHLQLFDAISKAYDAVIRRALSATKDSEIYEATQMTASIIDYDQMQAELKILKNRSIQAKKDTINEQLEEMALSEVTEYSSANPILAATKLEDQRADININVKKAQVHNYSAAFMTS